MIKNVIYTYIYIYIYICTKGKVTILNLLHCNLSFMWLHDHQTDNKVIKEKPFVNVFSLLVDCVNHMKLKLHLKRPKYFFFFLSFYSTLSIGHWAFSFFTFNKYIFYYPYIYMYIYISSFYLKNVSLKTVN